MRLSQRLTAGAIAMAAYSIAAASERRRRESARSAVLAVQAVGSAVAARACEAIIGDEVADAIIAAHERQQSDPRVN